MESLYYVLSWACHRRCKHCYEERFRPYVRDELKAVVSAAEANFPRIIANLPERLTYLDLEQPDDAAPGGYVERTSRIIVSGGEVLIDPVRETILYPALEQIRDKYEAQGGVKLVVQTTGDLLTERIIEELLARGIYMISVAGMDDFHVGMEGEKRVPLQERLTAWFEAAGMRASGHQPDRRPWMEDGPIYSFRGNRGCLDRQDLAARARLEQRPFPRHDHRQFLQCLVRRPQLPQPPLFRLRGLDRPEWRRLPVLPQNQGAPRQSD